METLFQRVCLSETLQTAWERVRENQGCPGIDSVSIEEFEESLQENLASLRVELESGEYRPLPLVRIPLQEEGGDERPIDVPTVRDRVVQQALLMVLTPIFEPHFLDCSYAYRPNRSTLQAIQKVENLIKNANPYILRCDVQDFFESISHQILVGFLKDKVDDQKILDLIARILIAGIMEGMAIKTRAKGIAQGMALSTLLSNIYLHPFDQALTQSGYSLVRYADDCAIPCPTEVVAHQVLSLARDRLKGLSLALNEKKTQIRHINQGFVFLGYYIDKNGRGPSQKALKAIEQRLIQCCQQHDWATKPSQGPAKLDIIIRGWSNYYGGCVGIKPLNLSILISLLRISLEQGNLAHARSLLTYKERFQPELATSPDLALELAELEERIGESAPTPLKAEPVEIEKVSSINPFPMLRRILHAHPDYAPAYRELAEGYAQLGQYGLAKKAFAQALELEPHLAEDEEDTKLRAVFKDMEEIVPLLSEAEMDLFLTRFVGRQGVYARQWIDDQGHRGFTPVRASLSKQELRQHLAGQETLGIYLIQEDGTVHLMVIDVDIDKKVLLERARDKAKLAELDQLTQKDANRIGVVCGRLELPIYIEDSGYKGRHCWFFFEEAIPAKTTRQLANALLKQVGPASLGIHWEIFPNQDNAKEGRLGPLIKLPLGVHKKTGRRCLFVDQDSKPYPDQAAFFAQIRPITKEKVESLLRITQQDKEEGPFPSETLPDSVEALLNGCTLIRHLVNKARDTNYLNNLERVSLLYTLGHLGDEGKNFLHKTLGQCLNYNFNYTEQQIKRMKECPISCARLQEYHEELLQPVGCPCGIKPPPKGYPSPVLYAYRKGHKPKQLREAEKEKEPGKEPEVVMGDVNTFLKHYIELKKQYRGIEKGIRECEKKLSQIFDQTKVDSMQTELGLLVRKREGQIVDWWIDI